MDLIAGRWIELEKYNYETAQKLFQYGAIQNILLKEVFSEAPKHDFLLIIEKQEQMLLSEWKMSPHFKGFLLRTSNALDFEQIPKNQKFWVEYVFQNWKQSINDLPSFQSPQILGLFLTPAPSMRSFRIHNLLNHIQKNLKLNLASSRPFDLPDQDYSDLYKLELFQDPIWENNQTQNFELSVIIPHFESPHFVCNVLSHLEKAYSKSRNLEVLVVDDSSSQESFQKILYFSKRHLPHLPLRIFQWPDVFKFKNRQKIFRAGASRNWGSTFAKGKNLLFLDADMLVPDNISELVSMHLQDSDVLQFVRKHIPIEKSHETSSYDHLHTSTHLYTEESKYWSPFFDTEDWNRLPDHWKFTCTYALAISRDLFFEVGRLRRNFIRYGFEDTDLGYRLWKNGSRFLLVKTPMLHLTGVIDKSQSRTYRFKKLLKLRPMAQEFYRLNLDPKMYLKFQSLLD